MIASDPARTVRRKRRWLFLAMALVFLVPAAVGFGTKFVEFVSFVGAEEGAFTIVPIVNYVLASLGFVFLMGWAANKGMFENVEKPKFTMLENEHRLDEEAAHARRPTC